jgi:hypothetical protein
MIGFHAPKQVGSGWQAIIKKWLKTSWKTIADRIIAMKLVWKTSLLTQFGAAIDMLENALNKCPDELWEKALWEDDTMPEGSSAFWNIAYHTLFWLDLYLSGTVDGFAPPVPFTLDELEVGKVTRVFTRTELQNYLVYDRKKCQVTISGLTDEEAKKICRFGWGELPYMALLFDNMRHVQEHAAQLNMFLGQNARLPSHWVAKAK